jgi:HlyD family secretion protein
LAIAIVLAGVAAGAIYALLPAPVGVDVAAVARGPIEVTVEEEGMTRIRDVYRISAPVGGYLDRFPLEIGDSVKHGATVIAEIRPSVPSFLDARSRSELAAAAEAARAAVELATAEVSRARAQLGLAESDLERAERLSASGTISARAMDKAVSDAEMARAQLREAEANRALRESELRSAADAAGRRQQWRCRRLLHPGTGAGGRRRPRCPCGERAGRGGRRSHCGGGRSA